MRTTLAIDDEVFESVQEYAREHEFSLGKAVSELVRRGLAVECPIVMKGDLAVLSPGPEAPMVTGQDVARLETEVR